jgi:adenylate cyclase
MRKRAWRGEVGILPAAVGLLAALATTAAVLADPWGLATTARERAFDLLYAAFPRAAGAGQVIVVDIDRRTLSRLGGWPLPRNELARLTDKLALAHAGVIAFDIFFPGPDRHSPRVLAAEIAALPGGEKAQPLIAELPDTDERLAEALRRAPTVLGVLAAPGEEAPLFNLIRAERPLARGMALRIDGVSGPYAPLAEAALGLGIQSLFGEEGGLVRRAPLIAATDMLLAPGLAIEAARVATGAAVIDLDAQHATADFASHRVSLTQGGAMRIHWSDPARWPARTISAADVLDGKVADRRLRNAAVLIGSSAPEAGALRPAPPGPLTPSVQIEAEALEQLLAGVAPLRPGQALAIEVAAMLALGCLAITVAVLRGPAVAAAALVLIVVFWLGVVAVTFRTSSLLLDSTAPILAAIVGGNVAAAAAFARTRRLKGLIGQRFAQYLAPQVVRTILEHPERLKREGELREITALFTDIEGFTPLTTRVGPQRLIALLDAYFDGVCRVITAHGGMIDLIVGDAVHAFFNMPFDVAGHADKALDCALAILDFAEAFRSRPEAATAAFGRTRIGIETGPAVVGDVGGPGRFNYTAHGEVANTAARLEAANKEFRTSICAGPGTAAAVRPGRLIPIGRVQLRGFDAPIEVYAPTASRSIS